MFSIKLNLTSIFCLVVLLSYNHTYSQTAEEIFQMSKTSFDKGLFSDALVTLNKCMKKDSSKADYFLLRANIFFKLSKYDAAISDCYSALSREPDKPEVFYLRGQLCQVTKSYGGAILFFGKTLKFSKKEDLTFNAYLNRGNAFFEMGKYNDAYNDFVAATNLRQEDVNALYELALTNYKLLRVADAKNILEKIRVIEPEFSPAYELSGEIASGEKKFDQAIRDFDQFVKLNPTNPGGFCQLAQIYLSVKEFDKALFNINTSINLQPTNPAGYKVKGLIYLQQNQIEEGCNNLFKALQLGYLENVSFDLLDLYMKNCESE